MPRRLPASFGTPDESGGYRLTLAANAWQRRVKGALAEVGLTHTQYLLLAGAVWLSREDTPVTQVRLARHARTDAMTTSQVVRTLTTRRLLRRASHPSDTRAVVLRPTSRGRKLAREASYIVDRVDREFFSPVEGTRFKSQLGELGIPA